MLNEEENFIKGEVAAIFFENDTNYYKVLLIEIEDTNTDFDDLEIVVTGTFGPLKESVSYTFYGQLVNHPKYGKQMKVDRYEQARLDSKEAVIAFLSGPQFKGIGLVTASNIVEALGEDAVSLILADPDCLDGIEGVTALRKNNLIETLQEEQGMDQIILTLNRYGLNNTMAYKIYDQYEEKTLEVIQTNPYQLVEDIERFSFARADALAEEINIEADADERLRAALLQTLSDHCFQSGDTYILHDAFIRQAIHLLEAARPFIIETQQVEEALSQLTAEQMIAEDGETRYYLKSLYNAELGIVSHIQRLKESDEIDIDYEEEDIDGAIAAVEKEQGFNFGSSQKDAIKEALVSPIFILTGGPGTGKTTVVNGLVKVYSLLTDSSLDPHSYKNDTFPVILAAPTGRAAKRLGETTNLESGTIHRLLGLGADDDFNLDPKYYDNQLSGQLLIIDEMSMVDTWLCNHLLSAVPDQMQVILIGDKDQLPSVGPGQVFSDLIESRQLPLKELNEIYRQESDSSIPFLAAHIKNNTLPHDFGENKSDRSFIPCQTQQVVNAVSQVAARAVEKGFTIEDLQVLAPMYKGPAGIDQLNVALQNVFNPNEDGSRKEIKNFETIYRIGDKVLQLTNEPELQIFNGDIGIITGISYANENADKTDKLTILFDTIEVEYSRNHFNKVTLAYCMSIHKAQGSEFKVVILPFVKSYHRMLRKDLLYTAITRASDWLILCGEEEAYSYSLTQDSANRQTSLVERLSPSGKKKPPVSIETVPASENDVSPNTQIVEEEGDRTKDLQPGERYVLSPKMVENESIAAMIGMEDITPYDLT
ncbi:MAG: ATP-dependent RecD-like DNA helicase [Atopococcus tabaci]|uniref:ATP-dependent RecD2 DNA helicase n=1 Tax=Atopococcus tabaci TaxID=269774 RepID=A0AA43UD44_9LACT|nr:ATP-dependent RecD-like DNA helicase [Atopococcus tabaci]